MLIDTKAKKMSILIALGVVLAVVSSITLLTFAVMTLMLALDKNR